MKGMLGSSRARLALKERQGGVLVGARVSIRSGGSVQVSFHLVVPWEGHGDEAGSRPNQGVM